ncbi:MAG: hypothetical protein M0Q43_13040 [Methanothrix sp.]|nr:hypothetical protein [Methanothrix sp.]
MEENGTAYDNPTTLEEKSLKFNFEQNVSGTGFFTAYKYAQMPNALGTEGQQFNGVEAKNKAHGSGKINTDSTIYAESSYSNKTWINGAYDEDGEEIEDEEGSTSIIQMKEDSKMTYSPLAMGIGSRYYNHNPVVFNSLLSEDDWIKNRDDFNSMHHRIDRAHGLNKVLEAQSNAGDDTVNTAMDVEEDLIDGRAHFGVLQLEGIPADEEPEEGSEEVQVLGLAMKAWKKPLIDIDEDYVGSYHIKKNMDISTYTDEDEEEDSWLPCCFAGFGDMNYADAEVFKSARGVFDCTCFNVPIRAQFAG